MWLGIVMLVGCHFAGFYYNVAEARWFVAAVAAITTMAEYLTRTYLFMHRESIAQLNRHFDQPVLNSYHLAAKRQMCRHIIHEVLKTNSSPKVIDLTVSDQRSSVSRPLTSGLPSPYRNSI
ncbi:hypothetical protein [Streptomyces sp. PA03-2a]|uniref:hypothetical protein n=1 Tax=Streptomyces sp. PA03-2a TaxID=3028701 RepID=UPI00299F9DD0|nr:hypothetical protein [Streptomyces sp. PA03-2a]MDX2730991.1 hypothetical protein [Streptomyces sp. PA03-2a]